MRSLARLQKRVAFALAAVMVVAMLATIMARLNASHAQSPGQPPNGHTLQSNVAVSLPGIGSTLTTGEGLAVTLVGIEKHGTRWLFHVRMANSSVSDVQVAGSQNNRFVLPARAANGSTVDYVLSSPAAAELAAHPTLPQRVIVGGSADGWIAGDVSQLGYSSTPATFIYEYDPIASQKCSNPTDPSTCSPVNLYHMLLWGIS